MAGTDDVGVIFNESDKKATNDWPAMVRIPLLNVNLAAEGLQKIAAVPHAVKSQS